MPLRSLLCAGITFLVMNTAMAQQEVMVSQYMFNGLFLNPAYAGTHSYVSGSLLHRMQWMKVEGAPRTSMLAVDGPVLANKMGLGLSVVNDEIGVSRDLEFAGHYSYHLNLGYSKLSFGLKAGVSMYSARLSDLTYWDANDAVFQGNISNTPVGKFGFGVYWYEARSYIGLSVPTIYAADDAISSTAPAGVRNYFERHYYLNAGRIFPLNDHIDLKSSVLVKYQPNAPFEVDLNCNMLYRERFWLGLGYRTGDALTGMIEFQVNPMFRLGYAYDMTVSPLRNYTSGSHEVMLGIDLGKEMVKIKTPRYF